MARSFLWVAAFPPGGMADVQLLMIRGSEGAEAGGNSVVAAWLDFDVVRGIAVDQVDQAPAGACRHQRLAASPHKGDGPKSHRSPVLVGGVRERGMSSGSVSPSLGSQVHERSSSAEKPVRSRSKFSFSKSRSSWRRRSCSSGQVSGLVVGQAIGFGLSGVEPAATFPDRGLRWSSRWAALLAGVATDDVLLVRNGLAEAKPNGADCGFDGGVIDTRVVFVGLMVVIGHIAICDRTSRRYTRQSKDHGLAIPLIFANKFRGASDDLLRPPSFFRSVQSRAADYLGKAEEISRTRTLWHLQEAAPKRMMKGGSL